MSIPATRAALPMPVPATVTVLLYAPEGGYAARLADRLEPHAMVRWSNSRGVPVTQLTGNATHEWHVLLLDFSRTHAQYSANLARQLAMHDPTLPVVGVGTLADGGADCVLTAMRAGVRDFIDLDASLPEMLLVLRKAMTGAPVTSHLRPAPPPAPNGRMVALLGVRAGVGCSTLAVHLASLRAAGTDAPPTRASPPTEAATQRTLLFDLGIPVADCALYLGLHSEFDCDSVLENAERFDATLARTMLPSHASGAEVLSRNPQQPANLPEEARIAPLLDRLSHVYPTLLCDLGGLLPMQMSATFLSRADEIWIVTDQSVSALIALSQVLTRLETLGLRDRLRLVVNRHEEHAGASATQIAKRFGLPLLATLPERATTLRATASQGELLQQRHPRDPYLKALQPLLSRLSAPASQAADREPTTEQPAKGLLARLPWTKK